MKKLLNRLHETKMFIILSIIFITLIVSLFGCAYYFRDTLSTSQYWIMSMVELSFVSMVIYLVHLIVNWENYGAIEKTLDLAITFFLFILWINFMQCYQIKFILGLPY